MRRKKKPIVSNRAEAVKPRLIADENQYHLMSIPMTEYSTLYDQLKYRGVNGKIHDVFEAIRNYSGPVLIIHGDKDKVVDISYGRRATEVYKHAEFVCLPGESHGFIGAGRKKAAQLSYEFL